MASPFPGMDPYLEGEMWQEFHETLAGAIRGQLLPQHRQSTWRCWPNGMSLRRQASVVRLAPD